MQFLGESIILTLIAMFIAAVIVQSVVPYLDTFLGKHIEINFLQNPGLALILFAIGIFIGLLAGIYPALVLSSFKPISVLRGKFKSTGAGIFLRRVLVVFQFAITTALILGVLIVIIQINYLKNLDMGYDRSNIVVIPNFFQQGDDLLKNELEKIPAITGIGRISGLPGTSPIRIEAIPEGMDRENSRMFQQYVIDSDLTDLLKLDIIKGRKFNPEFASDTPDNIIINETAAKIAGWSDPINKRLDLIDVNADLISKRVIGVVKDFHYTNPRNSIEPMFFMYNPQQSPLLYVRIKGDPTEVLKTIEAKYKEIFPDRPFNNIFLDNFINQQFNQDRAFAGNIGFFSGVAILIACLGLLGLVSFAVNQRRHEVAIRKVLGSGETRIVSLLAMDFLKWVALANIIAWPLGYFGMSAWLNEFVFKVPFTIWPYLASAFGTLIIALLTISLQSIRAARANPTESLRVE